MLPFEIETVSFRIFKPPRVLFICRACGLARAEGDERPVARRRKSTKMNIRKRPERGWILRGAESADEPDRYGDESSANP
jgi:hypothetical protein